MTAPHTQRPDIPSVLAAVDRLIDAKRTLAKLGVTRSEKLLSDYGEWLVGCLLGGIRASSSIQPCWDVDSEAGKIEVKTHAKAATNRTRWTEVGLPPFVFDHLAILVLSDSWRIREFYLVPKRALLGVIAPGSSRVRWGDLEKWRVTKASLPRSEELHALFVR
jgi:hypothetical protein